jgi:putative NIF3 family GTP cyclohydrolase 1 type 2
MRPSRQNKTTDKKRKNKKKKAKKKNKQGVKKVAVCFGHGPKKADEKR